MSGNLSVAAQALLSKVQALFGPNNVTVTSTTRSAATNAATAGASNTSQHLTGDAFDFKVTGFTPAQVQSTIAGSGISFGQSIQEYGAAAGTGTNHLGVGSKGQLLTGTNGSYKTTGYAAATGFSAGAWLDSLRSGEASFLKSLGFGDSAAKVLTDPNADPVDAALAGINGSVWFQRIGFALLALLLIGAAIFMLAGKPAMQIASKVPPLPV